ncbi:Hypothetical predicted protein, partial [Paramuricea clavata]
EGADKDGCPYPQFEALVAMMENESEICLGHPVSVKYVNEKWRKRGFKYNLFSIILNLIFHICLMIYTIKLIGEFKIVCSPGSQDHGKNCRNSMERKNETAKENEIAKENETAKTPKRIHRELDAPVMIMLRIILLTITFASMSKDIFQKCRHE